MNAETLKPELDEIVARLDTLTAVADRQAGEDGIKPETAKALVSIESRLIAMDSLADEHGMARVKRSIAAQRQRVRDLIGMGKRGSRR